MGCSTADLIIYITRNEWRQAQQLATRYRFYAWDLSGPHLFILTPDQIAPDIPAERGSGQWQSVRLGPLAVGRL